MAMQSHTEFLKFSDKIYFNSTHYQGSLSLYYVGNQCIPVVDQQKGEFPKHFERCVYQVQQVRSHEQQAFLWGEAAETAKYVCYGQTIKLWNVFSNRCLTCEGDDDRDETRMKATMTPPVDHAHLPPGHPAEQQHLSQLFRIMPKYKIREVGERVRLEDQIVLENVASSLYMHATSVTTSLTNLWKSHQEEVMESKGVQPLVQHLVDFQNREQKGAAWQMEPYETDKDREVKQSSSGDQAVMAGSAIVVYHREAEGFLLCDWQVQDAEHTFLDHHKIQKATFNVLDLPYSSNALWVLEAENAKKGGAVMYHRHRKHYRLKHMATGLYLTLNCWNLPDGTRMRDITTTYSPDDKHTLIGIVPLDTHDTSDALTVNSFARLCFHHEEVWLHATGEFSVDEPVRTDVSEADHFKSASLGTSGKLQRVETTRKGYYEDVFAIRVVQNEEKESVTQVCNMVTTLQRFHQYWKDLKQEREEEKKAIQDRRNRQMQRGLHSSDKRLLARTQKSTDGPSSKEDDEDDDEHGSDEEGQNNDNLPSQKDSLTAQLMKLKRNTKNQESSKLIFSAQNALKSLVLFCTDSAGLSDADPFTHHGPPMRRHQLMLFQQNVHNLVFKILKAPMEYGGLTSEDILKLEQYQNLSVIYALAYRLIKLMVKGAKDMSQQMASFLPFIESQLGELTSIADAYMQIICDNDRLLESLVSLQLESFLWLIPQYGRKSTYMTLLSACCTCEDEGIEQNQALLIRKMRNMDRLNLMYPLKVANGTIKIRPISGFPANTERKIRRFKRRRELGEEDECDDDSSESDSSSEDDDRGRAMSPYAMRYSPRSRSASPQAALLSVAYNIPSAMSGIWVYSCDVPSVSPRWVRQWLRCSGGCLLLSTHADDLHPRTIPLYMFQRAKKDHVAMYKPPEAYAKNGITLMYKVPKGERQDDEGRNERRLLICMELAQDRIELLAGLRREIKHAASVDDFDLDLPTMVNSATASLGHMRAQINALRVRNTHTGDVDDLAAAGEGDEHLWQDLETWIQEADPDDVLYFEHSLRFLASLCVGGNENAIGYVRKRYPPDLILAGINLAISHPQCDTIRSGFVLIARHMFIESGLHEKTDVQIKSRLKDTVYDYIMRNSRQEASAAEKNMLLTEMLQLALSVISSGCYTAEELEHLFHPLLKLLDGTSDLVASDDFLVQGRKAVQEYAGSRAPNPPGSPRDPGSPRTQRARNDADGWGQLTAAAAAAASVVPASQSRRTQYQTLPFLSPQAAMIFNSRYCWTERTQRVVEAKLTCCKILQWMFDEGERQPGIDVGKWVSRIAKVDRRLGRHPEGRFLDLKTDLLTQVLLDVTMYKGYPALFRTALQLALMNIAEAKGDPAELRLEENEAAVRGLAEILKADLLGGNPMMTMNLFRHFSESKEDNLTITLLRVFKTMIDLHPSKREIERMQSLLDDLGVTPIVTQMIESKDESVVSEGLLFGHALLQGGNAKVQQAVLDYFLSLNDEAFFSCTKDRMTKATQLIKNTESTDQHKAALPNKRDSVREFGDSDGNSMQNTSAQDGEFVGDSNYKYKQCDLYHLEKVMRFLQLFCEGHNAKLQDYLREQDDNVHTYNLVKETINALKHLLTIKQCDTFIFSHVVQAFNTLTEYCQGPCAANQLALVNANIAMEVNVVLSRPLPLVNIDLQDELKNAALTVLLSVVEGVEDAHIPTVITRTLDFKLVDKLLCDIWSRRKEENALDLGFTAFMLLRTLSTFDEALNRFVERCEGYAFYTALTGRIEIFRNGSLVRVYFRIPFICANLSDKTKDELLWNVNRETPTARIADFYDRAEELIYEIEFYERSFKEACDPVPGAFFPNRPERLRQCKYLINSTITLWENIMIVIAFVINTLVCLNYVTDMSDEAAISRKPLEGFHVESELVRVVLSLLMLCQFVVCVFLLFDFWVAKAPLIAHRRMKKERQLMMKRARKKFSLKKYIEMFENDNPELDGSGGHSGGHPSPGSSGLPGSRPPGMDYGSQDQAKDGKVFEQLKKFADRTGCNTPAGIGGSFGAVARSVTSGYDESEMADMTLQKAKTELAAMGPDEGFGEQFDPDRGLLTFDYTLRYTFYAVYSDTQFVFLAASVIFALAGICISPFFIALHLVSIINRSTLLQNVIKAVTKNGRSLLLTVLLGIIIIYLFSVIGFVLFRESFQNTEPNCEFGGSGVVGDDGKCTDYHCDTLFRCFVFAVTAGIRSGGGIGDLMQAPDWNHPYNSARTLFDFLFFVIVIVILLNIIFGVIIDTFAELRSEKQKIEDDIRSRCFICGIESSQFDRKAVGFEHHIKNDHNMWNYIYFVHHLQKKDPDEFTGQESYVHAMMSKGDLSFFPLNKAVCLEGKQEEDDQVVELTAIHEDTKQRVTQVEQQVTNFRQQFTKENEDMKEYLEGVTTKVVEATAKRHSILGGLYAAIQKEQTVSQDGPKMRPLTPVG